MKGVKVLATRADNLERTQLRTLVDNLRNKLGSGVVVLGSVSDGKVALIVGVTKDLTGKIQAGKIIAEVAKKVGGSGGGRPDMAEAGGKDPGGAGCGAGGQLSRGGSAGVGRESADHETSLCSDLSSRAERGISLSLFCRKPIRRKPGSLRPIPAAREERSPAASGRASTPCISVRSLLRAARYPRRAWGE